MGKIEYYTLKPSLRQYFGRKVNKSLKFDEWTENKKVHQIMENGVLTTYINEERTINILGNGKEEKVVSKEESKIVQEIPTGVILIWDKEQGYIIPQYQMATLEEIERELMAMKNVYEGDANDAKGNEK